jgi:hypothetical protein
VFRWGIYGSEAEFNKHGFEYMFISFFIVTAIWVTATLLTRPCDMQKLREFYEKVRPAGPGWKPVSGEMSEPRGARPKDNLKVAFVGWLAAVAATLSALFGVGKLVLCDYQWGVFWLIIAVITGVVAFWSVHKLTAENQ